MSIQSGLPAEIPGLRVLAERYDAFFVDIWGVLHDGLRRYPGAREGLTFLQNAGKTVILLSNAPRRAYLVREKLRLTGIPDGYYTDIVSSGETTRAMLARGAGGVPSGGAYIKIGGARDGDLAAGLPGFRRVYTVEEADFVLLTGYEDAHDTHEEGLPLLRQCAKRGLLIVNANPDKRIERMNGRSVPCAGSMVDAYKEIGGEAVEIGKPYACIYEYARERTGLTAPAARTACIGDNMDTDIKGACDNGMEGYLIASGMHVNLLKEDRKAFFGGYGALPAGVLAGFSE